MGYQLLDVPGYPGIQASQSGNIYKDGEVVFGGLSDGYVMVYVGDYKSVDRAKLVCLAFHGEKPEDADLVAHINGHKQDDRPENLYWATWSDNMLDAYEHGTKVSPWLGESHWKAKLTENDVLNIRSKTQESSFRLSVEYGVSQQTINDIRARRSWRHI
jgi:hypothetical protein